MPEFLHSIIISSPQFEGTAVKLNREYLMGLNCGKYMYFRGYGPIIFDFMHSRS
jgi:hypothetical protein